MSTGRAALSLKYYRKRQGLTQEQIAEQARVGTRTVQRLERGGPARYGTLARLADVLSVSVEELCEPPPAASHATGSPRRWDVIPVSRVASGASLVDLVAGRHALHFSRIDVDGEADRDLVAEFEEELQEDLDVIAELRPIARRDCKRSLQRYLDQLEQRGLGMVGGSKAYRLTARLMTGVAAAAQDLRWAVAYIAVGPRERLPGKIVRDLERVRLALNQETREVNSHLVSVCDLPPIELYRDSD